MLLWKQHQSRTWKFNWKVWTVRASRSAWKYTKEKQKFMTNYNTNESIEIGNEQIEKVDTYRYLAQTVKMFDNPREEVLIRIKAGWRCFGMYIQRNPVWQEGVFIQRERIFNQCVLMTYGCETWIITTFLKQKKNGDCTTCYEKKKVKYYATW